MLKNLSRDMESSWLCVPGVGSFSSSFELIAKSLIKKNIGLIALELIDVFKTQSAVQDVVRLADLIAEALPDLLSASSYTILGHSFGGRVAYELGKRRSDQALDTRIVMIDALPKNFPNTKEPANLPMTEEALLRWYISTFPPAFLEKFSAVPDAELAEALISSRVFRRDDIADFTDAMRRQILAHNAYSPDLPVSNHVDLQVIVPEAGIFAGMQQARLATVLNETADAWKMHATSGDHYSILKRSEEILEAIL